MFGLYPRLAQAIGLALLLLTQKSALADSQAAQDRLYKAVYLEEEKSDYAAAARLYEEILADRQASQDVRAEATRRLEGCRDEIACADFAKLMPPETLAYLELNRPGERLRGALDALGLLGDHQPTARGAKNAAPRIAVSPALLDGLLGIRGAAVAITGINIQQEGRPSGVAVFHAGKVDILRGLIETALPAAALPTDPIEGYATYVIEDEVYVTLTSRLAIVSDQTSLIEGVVDRLKNGGPSLADAESIGEALQQRNGSLLYFCVNMKPLLPIINAGMAVGGTQVSELALARQMLDLDSLRALTGRIDLNRDGLFVDLTLQLDKDHRNLVFNLIRSAPIHDVALQSIPEGAAGFVIGALNEAPPTFPAAKRNDVKVSLKDGRDKAAGAELPPVSALDIGREVFANIIGYAVFVLPPSDGAVTRVGRDPIPDIGAVFTVKDPDKSAALWTEALGIASAAMGRGALEGGEVDIEGVSARQFTFAEGITVYFATVGNDVFVSPSRGAISRAIATQRGGKSIVQDAAFSRALAQFDKDATWAMLAHAGRCAEIGRMYMSKREAAEMEPYVSTMTETVAALRIHQSRNTLRLALSVTGLPKIDGVIAQQLQSRRDHARSTADAMRALNAGDFAAARRIAEQANIDAGTQADMLRRQFQVLALRGHDRGAALQVGQQLFDAVKDDAGELNAIAWQIVSEQGFGSDFAPLALKMAQRCNELTEHGNWMYVDTLAHALSASGDQAAAVKWQRKAVELAGDSPRKGEAEAALARFEQQLAQSSGNIK